MNITTRYDLGKLFQQYNILGVGAEIGVQNGFNAQRIFEHWKGKIILVDRWDRAEELKLCVQTNMFKYYKLLIGDSVEMADHVPDSTLDWIYIDAGHSYKEVKADFEAWYPKVRKGGIVSGHDYGENDCIGVKQFIDEYIKLNPDIEMNFTTDDFFEGREYQTWWFEK
jgi:hypothetical protein